MRKRGRKEWEGKKGGGKQCNDVFGPMCFAVAKTAIKTKEGNENKSETQKKQMR